MPVLQPEMVVTVWPEPVLIPLLHQPIDDAVALAPRETP